MGKYRGVRKLSTKGGNDYEIDYQIKGKRYQYGVNAKSLREAASVRTRHMAKKLKESEGLGDTNINVRIGKAYRLLLDDVKSDTDNRKTLLHYKRTFRRMYGEMRKKEYPNMKSVSQTSLQFVSRYKSYFSNDLGNSGWGAELTFVKSMIKRFFRLGLCEKKVLDDLEHLSTPEVGHNKKEYKNHSDSQIKQVLEKIKKEVPEYYPLVYYLARTGRRIEESTLIDRKDIEWEGLKPVRINIKRATTKQKNKNLTLELVDKELSRVIAEVNRSNKKKKETYLFLNDKGKKVSQKTARRILKRISKEVLKVEVTPHYFRHRFLTKCNVDKVPIQDAMSIAGITDIKVVLEYYSHTTKEGLSKAYASSQV